MYPEPHIINLLEKYIDMDTIYSIKNVRIISKDKYLMKFLLLPKRMYRTYYLEIFNTEKQYFNISFSEKKELQKHLSTLMFYIKNKVQS